MFLNKISARHTAIYCNTPPFDVRLRILGLYAKMPKRSRGDGGQNWRCPRFGAIFADFRKAQHVAANRQRFVYVLYQKKRRFALKMRVLSKGKFHFDHNFSRSAWIEIRFGTVAKLEKLNNFPTDRPEVDVTKKSTFRCTPLKRGGT